MLKGFTYLLLITMLICGAHSAEEDQARIKFSDFVPDIVIKFSEFQDLGNALSYIVTCKQVNKERVHILVVQIPNIYDCIGKNITEAFFSFPHPDWKPWELLPEIHLKLHQCYIEGFRINIPTTLPPEKKFQPADDQNIRDKFRLMYSAAYGGHFLAAEEVGSLLLNPLYHGIIPLVIRLEDLVSEAKEWDVCRLNKPSTTNPKLFGIMTLCEDIFHRNDGTYFTQEERKNYSLAIKELSLIEKTDETIVLNKFLEEAQFGMRNGNRRFEPKGALALEKKLGYKFPFLKRFRNYADHWENIDKEEETPTTAVPDFSGILNDVCIGEYIDTLRPYIYNETHTRDPRDPSHVTTTSSYYNTSTSQEAMRKHIESFRIAVLLGKNSRYSVFLDLSMSNVTDFIHFKDRAALDKSSLLEHRISIFLLHLLLTRKPETSQFGKIQQALRRRLVDFSTQGRNPLRWNAFIEAFPGRYATELYPAK